MHFVERLLTAGLDNFSLNTLPKQPLAPSKVTDTSEETKPTQPTELTKDTPPTKWTKPTRNTDIGVGGR
jgi:hypothetical protein